ncbi:MAG: polysaccharide biosynthesis tyrosine autokinase [Terracidiphilus sp.]
MKSSSLQTAEPVLPASAEIGLPQSPISGEDSVGKFVQFLKKRGWLILAATAIGLTAAIIVNFMSTRLYTASAQVEIVPDRSDEFRLTQIQDFDGGDDAEKLNTETEILQSRTLALGTIKSLHLESNPDFLPLPNGRPWDLSQPAVRDTLVDVFRGRLNIARQGHTTILAISFTSHNPNLASLVVNNLIDNYIERSFRDNYASTAKVSGWLSSQLNDLKGNLEKSQQQMIKYQKDLGIVGLDTKDSVITASLEEMNKQLADVEVDRMVKEARLRSIQNSPPEVIDAAAFADPALQASKQQLAQLRTQYTAMMQTYGSAYTPLRAIKAQIDQLEHNLKTAENAEITRAEKEFEAARANEEMLRKSLSDEEQKAFDNGQKGIQFEFARSQYEANRLLYDGLQQRLQEAGIIAGLHTTSIHVVDSADIPTYPSSPRTRINAAIGTTLGLMIGFGLALLLESLDTNLKTMTDIEQTLQMPLLAAIPSVEADELVPSAFREAAVSRGISSWSRMAEALRGLRTSILLSSPGAPPKVLMITSTRPAEGKSSIATLTAITFALNGSRVLLIDADLRRPSVHLRFRMGKGLGLSSVLSGKSTLEDAILEWPELPSLHIMTSGPIPPLPSELLGSKQMEGAIAELRSSYDFILIDTPPVLAVTDASILGRLTDAAILVIRYGAAQRHVVQRSVDLLDRSGTHLLGVAVNAVDFKAPEYSEYYGRKYYEYYGERNPE